MRKLLFILLLVLMSLTSNAQSILDGDMNHDGQKNITDVMILVDDILHGLKPEAYLTCPDDHHPHLIDLGLPSGTLWSCCNVGANKPEEYGGYYAWGETEEKTNYGWKNYIYGDSEWELCYYIGDDIAATDYDVAYVKWGRRWMMPSSNQLKELINNCTTTWFKLNDVYGCKLISNINCVSIFLPLPGFYTTSLYVVDKCGYYWSSTQVTSNRNRAYNIGLSPSEANFSDSERICGQSVRPVSCY